MTAGRRPNLLMLLADEWRQAALGVSGADPVSTPHLDRLAAQGCLAVNAVSGYPVCSPYRGMMLSGQYPTGNGVTQNCTSDTWPRGVGLRPEIPCWSDVLAAAGYLCGYIGKWHLDSPAPADVERLGHPGEVCWDSWTLPERRHGFAFWHAYGCNNRHREPHYWIDDAPRDSPVRLRRWSPEHETDAAIGFLRGRPAAQPFALVVSYNPPHMPFDTAPARYASRFADADPAELLTRPNVRLDTPGGRRAASGVRGYFSSIAGVDDQIGRLLAALDAEGLADDTVVVFTADHGEMLGSHGRMHKNVWYDEALLVPFIVRHPPSIPAGSRTDALISAVDVAPTLLALCGRSELTPPAMQGVDQSSALRGSDRSTADPALYLKNPDNVSEEFRRGLRTREWTYVEERDGHGAERVYLYDLVEDPYQMRELSAARPRQCRQLSTALRDRLAEVGEGRPPR